jgi:uncharacterized membrane-anchored protein YjiN (DUF445 family)
MTYIRTYILHLKESKNIAILLLIAAIILFITSIILQPKYKWMEFFKAVSEAAMIGAVADWFAVVALFRKPLKYWGWHTQIVHRNKEKIGENLGNFVTNYFISTKILYKWLKPINSPLSFVDWLNKANNLDKLVEFVSFGLKEILNFFNNKDVNHFIKESIKKIEIASLIEQLLLIIKTDNKHQILLDEVLRLSEDLIRKKNT